MGLLNVVISAAGKFLDVVGLLLDLNFLIVHTVVRTFLAVVAFIADLPSLTLNLLLQVGNLLLSSAVYLAQGTLSLLGGTALALEGLLESLKMVGYLSMHVLLRGKEHLCRGLVSVVEACGIAVSLVVYFANTVVNFALIATQNVYLAAVGAWQTVSAPLQEALELALTSFTFLHSSLAGTSAVLWSPCKLLLDFVASLLQMFVSVFILNVYGLLLTVTIALTTTAYLNPRLSRQVAVHVLVYVNSFPALRRTCRTLWLLVSTLGSTPRSLRRHIQHLQRRLRHLHLLERRFWQQVSHLSSLLGLVLRTMLQRDNVNRARGDGDAGDDRRDPPDGRAGDGAQQEPSSSDRSLKTSLSLGKDRKLLPAESLLTLLKEQEERKKCVICQDCTKTVVLLPCRHLCLCRDCTNILLRQPLYQQNCPLCRHMILNTMDVYL